MKRLLSLLLLLFVTISFLPGCSPGGCGLEGEPPCMSKEYYIPGRGAWASRTETPGEVFLRELIFPKSKKHKTTIRDFDKVEQEYATKMIRQSLRNNRDGQLSKWNSPNNGAIYGSSGPVSTNGNCRDFVSYIQNQDETLQIGGTACKENSYWLFKKLSPIVTSKKPTTSPREDKNENKILRQKIARLEKEKQQSKPKVVAKRTPKPKTVTTGSGFFISRRGDVVTNAHVIDGCGRITVGDSVSRQSKASIVAKDNKNDLALLSVASLEMASANTQSLIKKLGIKIVPLASSGLLRSDDVRLGERVLVAGFPYGTNVSSLISVTEGIVSSVVGMGDDIGQFQTSAPIQPGNSGGPIYDKYGNIIGVVVAQLNKTVMAKQTGAVPENVNFGIKASTIRQFLTTRGVPFKWSNRKTEVPTDKLADVAQKQTVMVMCHQ